MCDLVYLVGKKQTQAIHQGLKDAGYDENKITVCESFMDAYNQASAVSGGQKIILIENDLPDNY